MGTDAAGDGAGRPHVAALTLPEPVAVRVTDDALTAQLSDGRAVAVPTAWFARLAEAMPDERAVVELTPYGIHWPLLDEDVSVEGMLAGWPGAETAASLAEWRARMDRRRAQIAAGQEPEPHYPTLPLPNDWFERAEGRPDGAGDVGGLGTDPLP